MLDPQSHDHLGALLQAACRRFASLPALLEMQRQRVSARHDYRGFERLSNKMARCLAGSGIGAGDRVALLMSNQSRWLISATAVFFRGAVLVPLDYKLTPLEQRALLERCGAKLLLCEYAIWQRWQQELGDAHARPLAVAVWVSEAPAAPLAASAWAGEVARWEELPDDDAPLPLVPRGRDDLACIVYSSGTGGAAKGCMLTHGNYLSQCASLRRLYPLAAGDRYFSILPTNHAIDFMCGFIGPFCGGAMVVHQRTLRPEFLLHTMQHARITHMALVPLLLTAFERQLRERLAQQAAWRRRLFAALRWLNAACTRQRPRPWLSRLLLPPVHRAFGGRLRVLFCGGAFVEAQRARFFYELGLPVVIGYGLSEACTVVTVQDMRPFRAEGVGKPLPGTAIELRSAAGMALPAGSVGEVWVRGPTVMAGYLDDAPQTAEVLQDGWLRSGDLGRLDASGHLHLLGRVKNMIVTAGGKNIYPEDIEGAFAELPCEELAIFAERYVWPAADAAGLLDERLLLVLRPHAQDYTAMLAALNRRLPEHKRVQALLEWHAVFPRTASLKLKRHELAAQLRAAQPAPSLQALQP